MSRVLLGVNLDSDISNDIRSLNYVCSLYFQVNKFKVLDLDTMLVEDVGIDGLDGLIDYEPCIDDQGFIEVRISCEINSYGFMYLANLGEGKYLVFNGNELASEDCYLIIYSFDRFDIIFNAVNYTYSIVVYDYDLTEYSYRVGSSDGECNLDDIELCSVSSLCEKIDDEMYLVNDYLVVTKIKKCIIVPNKVKKVLFGDYGWSEDLEYNIVIPPSVEHIDFNDLWWTDRINFKYNNYLQISLPSSNFDKLHKNVVDSIINKLKRKLARDFSLDTSRIITLYDNGNLPDEELVKLLDDLSIKIFKY